MVRYTACEFYWSCEKAARFLANIEVGEGSELEHYISHHCITDGPGDCAEYAVNLRLKKRRASELDRDRTK